MNVALCFFVIYIHVASVVMEYMDANSWKYLAAMSLWKLASCAVPGFFFLSALKLSLGIGKQGFSYPKYITSRIRRVWLPYIAAAAVYLLFFLYHNYMEFDLANTVKLFLDGNMSAHFYFVVAVMQFYLLAPIWRWLAKKLEDPVFAVIAVVSSYFIGLFFGQYLVDFIYIFYKGGVFPYSDRVFTTYIFWWVLGLAAGRHYERLKATLAEHTVAVTAFFAVAAVHNVFLTYVHNSGKTWIHWLDTAHAFYVVGAILFMLAVSVRLSRKKFAECAVIRYIDRSSYSIYLWHPLALYICENITAAKLDLSPVGLLAVRTLFGFVITVSLCAAVSVAADGISKAVSKRKIK